MVNKVPSIVMLVMFTLLCHPAPGLAQQDDSLGHLCRSFGTDLVHLPSRDTVTTLVVGGALTGLASTQDTEFADYAPKTHALEETLDAGAWTGGAILQIGGAFVTYVVGRTSHKPRVAHVGSDLVRAQVLNAILTQGIKVSVQRTRPDGSDYSFPSGHASASFASAAVLQRHFGWKVGLPAYGVASYVGLSRTTDNRHYLSDVVFGATIGLIAGHTVTIGHGRHQFALAPLSTRRGAGIQFVKLPNRS